MSEILSGLEPMASAEVAYRHERISSLFANSGRRPGRASFPRSWRHGRVVTTHRLA